MNTVMIIPTGIGCEIGGHSGDANPCAQLLGSVSDNLILHPNVVNASDINEMPLNAWYVEGSILDRFLEGKIELQKVKNNKILLVVNSPVLTETINAVSAARVTLGVEIEILELNTQLKMIARIENGVATGDVFGWKELIEQVKNHNFDALAIATPIQVERSIALNYLEHVGGVNPWGKVEAIASRLIANTLNKPVAHSPMEEAGSWFGSYNEIVDPRMAPEMVSVCYLHCILKGLHKAPRIGKGFSVKEVDVLVSPYGCWGRPHIACEAMGIPIIVVRENEALAENELLSQHKIIFVENYLEAVGVIQAIRKGISLESLRRPIKATKVIYLDYNRK